MGEDTAYFLDADIPMYIAGGDHPCREPCLRLLPRDAIHAAVMEAAGLHTILTADRHFDRLPGITRTDPSELAL